MSLEEELDSTKMRTAQQLSDMAMHLANLTDDIHVLRGGGGGGGATTNNGPNSLSRAPANTTSAASTQDKVVSLGLMIVLYSLVLRHPCY